MTIISRVSIRRPVKEVWTFFDNPANLPLWLTGFKRLETIRGTHGEVGAKEKYAICHGD